MYSENDLAKAALAIDAEMDRQWELGKGAYDARALAKAALDAQYLPAKTPPSPNSVKCMIYGHERTIVD